VRYTRALQRPVVEDEDAKVAKLVSGSRREDHQHSTARHRRCDQLPKGACIEFAVEVDWPELRLTEDQIITNACARAAGQPEPYPDHSIFSVRIPYAHPVMVSSSHESVTQAEVLCERLLRRSEWQCHQSRHHRRLQRAHRLRARVRLLKHVEVQQALQRQLTKVGLTEDQAIEELGELATRHVDKVSAADKIRALELFLKVKGSFAPEKPQVTEKHYYFGSLEALLALRRDSTPTASSQVMAQPALVLPALPEAIPGEIVG
jgi:hypothetical protein